MSARDEGPRAAGIGASAYAAGHRLHCPWHKRDRSEVAA